MYKLTVNGRIHEVDVEADMPLLWVLRDELGLTGTKYGCGVAECGACSVLLDGSPVRSCMTPVDYAVGRQITTIEGLASRVARAVQAAWEELDVVQCGYCQSGQIICAVALLEKTPRPGDADIDAAMGGNLCRCAAYLRIRAAIHLAATRLA